MKRTLLLLLIGCLVPTAGAKAQLDSARTYEAVDISTTRVSEIDPVTQTTVDTAALRRVVVGQDVQYVIERTVPSVISYSESGTNFSNYGSFRLRGIDQTRVNVTLNGVPLNDMIDQGVFFSNITDLTTGMASVQVQRGVGSSTNGTASYAGSIDLATPTSSGSANHTFQRRLQVDRSPLVDSALAWEPATSHRLS